MKRRKQQPMDLLQRFQTTCGWCDRNIPPNTEVFGGGCKARPGIDLAAHMGKVMPVYLVNAEKTVLVAVTGKDSDARREGHDLVYMACSEACAISLKAAFQSDIDTAKRLPLD